MSAGSGRRCDWPRTRRAGTSCSRRGTLRFASELGASLDELAEATGVPHETIERIIERE